MIDIIVILVIAVFVLLGVKSTIKHFKGEGACCGGGGGSLPCISVVFAPSWAANTSM